MCHCLHIWCNGEWGLSTIISNQEKLQSISGFLASLLYVSDMPQVSGFRWALLFPPPIKLTATM
jgi:hypothetical protein